MPTEYAHAFARTAHAPDHPEHTEQAGFFYLSMDLSQASLICQFLASDKATPDDHKAAACLIRLNSPEFLHNPHSMACNLARAAVFDELRTLARQRARSGSMLARFLVTLFQCDIGRKHVRTKAWERMDALARAGFLPAADELALHLVQARAESGLDQETLDALCAPHMGGPGAADIVGAYCLGEAGRGDSSDTDGDGADMFGLNEDAAASDSADAMLCQTAFTRLCEAGAQGSVYCLLQALRLLLRRSDAGFSEEDSARLVRILTQIAESDQVHVTRVAKITALTMLCRLAQRTTVPDADAGAATGASLRFAAQACALGGTISACRLARLMLYAKSARLRATASEILEACCRGDDQEALQILGEHLLAQTGQPELQARGEALLYRRAELWYPDAWLEYAWQRLGTADPDMCAEILDKTRKLADQPEAQCRLGWMLLQTGRKEEGLAVFSELAQDEYTPAIAALASVMSFGMYGVAPNPYKAADMISKGNHLGDARCKILFLLLCYELFDIGPGMKLMGLANALKGTGEADTAASEGRQTVIKNILNNITDSYAQKKMSEGSDAPGDLADLFNELGFDDLAPEVTASGNIDLKDLDLSDLAPGDLNFENLTPDSMKAIYKAFFLHGIVNLATSENDILGLAIFCCQDILSPSSEMLWMDRKDTKDRKESGPEHAHTELARGFFESCKEAATQADPVPFAYFAWKFAKGSTKTHEQFAHFCARATGLKHMNSCAAISSFCRDCSLHVTAPWVQKFFTRCRI